MFKSVLKTIACILGIIVCVICIPIIVLNVIIIADAYVDPDHIPDAFGVKPMICMSGSMSPEFEAGDLVFAKEVDTANLKVDDVICYLIDGTAVTHRIVEVVGSGNSVSYITKGDANNTVDAERVTPNMVEGIYEGVHIPKLGNFALFMQSTTGMILFVVCPLILLVVYNIVRQSIASKQEKLRAMELERELAAMKAKNQ